MTSVIHPNFRIGPGQRNIAERERAILIHLPQSLFDAMELELKHREYDGRSELIQKALERYLDVVEETSDSE